MRRILILASLLLASTITPAHADDEVTGRPIEWLSNQYKSQSDSNDVLGHIPYDFAPLCDTYWAEVAKGYSCEVYLTAWSDTTDKRGLFEKSFAYRRAIQTKLEWDVQCPAATINLPVTNDLRTNMPYGQRRTMITLWCD